MVLAERNTELVRNGRRSRGPSPNGHGANSAVGSGGGGTGGIGGSGIGGAGTPETSSDDDNSIKRNGKNKTKQSEYEEKIRVGRDYQAVCPPLIPEPERKPEILNDRALLVWSPTKDIPDAKLEEYISVAKEKYGYNGEQALGMLFWHKHDLERAVMDLANFTPFPDEWTVEDKVLFEQAFQFHGKSFHRIRQMLPDKSIASLVKYYYSWKKTRHRQSVMDRQEKLKAGKEGSENGSENGSNEESDNDDKDLTVNQDQATTSKLGGELTNRQVKSSDNAAAEVDSESATSSANVAKQRQHTPSDSLHNVAMSNSPSTSASSLGTNIRGSGICQNCGVTCHVLNHTPHGNVCGSCYNHWRRTNTKRPTTGPMLSKRVRNVSAERHKRKPPRGMYINHDDLVAIASSAPNNQNELLDNMEREIVKQLTKVQMQRQSTSATKRKVENIVEETRPLDPNRISARWTNDELLLAIKGVRNHGKDFQTIADIIGTKTEAHVRTFYLNYRRRYNLDQVLKKYEADKEGSAISTANDTVASGSSGLSKKEDKKKDNSGVSTAADESDNTTSSETVASKITIIEEGKSTSNASGTNSKSNATNQNNFLLVRNE